ncbi:MAG: protein-L-isoaspartate(D-aspartate) O-methyltransferase [Pirellulaceae bacterium]
MTLPSSAQFRESFETARKRMVDEVIIGAGVQDPKVIAAMRSTARHEFVAAKYHPQAYFDMALPIGDSQTISSPFIVAYMTESLDPQPTDRVLEIGTGSGYQAAVLSSLVRDVYTIEIVESLGKRAERTLKRLRYDNVHTKVGDGFLGWAEHAPFDKIIVTCSPEKVPQPLIDQLREGGLIVIPVGERYQQTLYLMRKKDGKLESEALRPTLFVPMTGAAENAREVKPDPANPRVVNGTFEDPPAANGFVSGWYYQRQMEWKTSDEAPQSAHYVEFSNEEAGRSSHLLQGLPIDGRRVAEVELSAWVKATNVYPGNHPEELPAVAISFYDENRQDVGRDWIGPFHGTSRWDQKSKTVRVPITAREAIVRIGLFGATGAFAVDDVKLVPTAR